MSTQQLLLLAAAALLVFWVLGAYNRLVALRNDIGAAWVQVDAPLQRRSKAITALVAALRPRLSDERGALDALSAAQTQVQGAADALRQGPALARRARALASAESILAAALARLLALLEQRPDMSLEAELAPHLDALHDAAPRLAFARQLFNDAVRAYNEAARQFPTRVLARVFGFGQAGVL
jgi:LemA protein